MWQRMQICRQTVDLLFPQGNETLNSCTILVWSVLTCRTAVSQASVFIEQTRNPFLMVSVAFPMCGQLFACCDDRRTYFVAPIQQLRSLSN